MDVAIAVALIAGAFTLINGIITARGSRIAARQKAIDADLERLNTLQQALFNLGEACNDYVAEAASEQFWSQDWEVQRGPRMALSRAHGEVQHELARVGGRPHVEQAVQKSLDASNRIAGLSPDRGQRKTIMTRWNNLDREWVLHAIETVGREIQTQHRELVLVTRWWLGRLVVTTPQWTRLLQQRITGKKETPPELLVRAFAADCGEKYGVDITVEPAAGEYRLTWTRADDSALSPDQLRKAIDTASEFELYDRTCFALKPRRS